MLSWLAGIWRGGCIGFLHDIKLGADAVKAEARFFLAPPGATRATDHHPSACHALRGRSAGLVVWLGIDAAVYASLATNPPQTQALPHQQGTGRAKSMTFVRRGCAGTNTTRLFSSGSIPQLLRHLYFLVVVRIEKSGH
jgi:hypothetical protein